MVSSFGTDHVRHRQAMAQVALADLCTTAGQDLLWQCLANENVVGIFLAPPCGSASRARSIPLKRKRFEDPAPLAPRPLRTDAYPNGIPSLPYVDAIKVSKANKLYFLTAQLVQWACNTGVIFCVENPQFSFFWQTSFIQAVIHLMEFTTFQSCCYGSTRPKRTMLAFNTPEFTAINAMCPGTSATHRHDKWGVAANNKFATAMETAYPMPLARMIAIQFVVALQARGIAMPPESLQEIKDNDLQALPALRAHSGVQPRASKLPPLIPTFAARVSISGFKQDLPSMTLLQKLGEQTTVQTQFSPTVLPKGAKLVQQTACILPPFLLESGAMFSRQKPSEEEIQRMVDAVGAKAGGLTKAGFCETQVWGIPWTEDEFVQQMVKFGHPSMIGVGLPTPLVKVTDAYGSMDAQQRMAHRATKLGYWLKVLVSLKDDELKLKQGMHPDVTQILGCKNVLLWKAMLTASGYSDMGVVDEFIQGSDLVGCVEKTGLWPTRFQPATITVDELCNVASKERGSIGSQFGTIQDQELACEVWTKTMEEAELGLLDGPLALDTIPNDYPLSRRFGIKQGAEVRCIDDFSRSAVNQCAQTCESPKPHTIDVFASLCVRTMNSRKEN